MKLLAALGLIVGAGLLFGAPRRVGLRTGETSLHRWVTQGGTAVRHWWTRNRRADARRREAAELILGLSAELTAGLPLDVALLRAAATNPVCPHAVSAATIGGDVAVALRRDAQDQGLPVLASLATVWQVAQGSGAGLAAAAHRLGTAAFAQQRMRRELAGQMAGPRATAKVLAVLPVVGLLLGSGLGGSPLAWLLGTPIGVVVLVVGVALDVTGLLWIRVMVTKVERRL